MKTTAEVVRQLTQKNELGLDILKTIFLNLIYILESLKYNKEKLYLFLDGEASICGLDSETHSLIEDLCEIRNGIAHGKTDKNKIKNIIEDPERMKDWNLELTNFIIKFLPLYMHKTEHVRSQKRRP